MYKYIYLFIYIHVYLLMNMYVINIFIYLYIYTRILINKYFYLKDIKSCKRNPGDGNEEHI